jgi:hypothetical protein
MDARVYWATAVLVAGLSMAVAIAWAAPAGLACTGCENPLRRFLLVFQLIWVAALWIALAAAAVALWSPPRHARAMAAVCSMAGGIWAACSASVELVAVASVGAQLDAPLALALVRSILAFAAALRYSAIDSARVRIRPAPYAVLVVVAPPPPPTDMSVSDAHAASSRSVT